MAFPFEPVAAAVMPGPSTLTISLAWTPVPETNIQGYRVFVGTASNQYSQQFDAGNSAAFSVPGLVSGETYYFAVKAIGRTGIEGERSDELVVPVTTIPNAVADTYTTTRDSQLVVPAAGVLANDSDMDSPVLTAVLDSAPAHGSLSLNSNGGFVYTPYAGFTGTDSFVYHAHDGNSDSATTIVDVVVKEPVFQILVNGSFEANYTGWTATGNLLVEPAGSTYAPTDGTKIVAFNGKDLAPNGVLSQSFATVVGETYTLRFDSGVVAFNTTMQRLLVNVVGKVNRLSQTITAYGAGTGINRWQSQSYTFVADSTMTTLSFKDDSPSSNSIDLMLDNVSVSGPRKSEVVLSLPESTRTPSLAGRPGAVTVGMSVAENGTYVLERSEDLVRWEVLDTTLVTAPRRIEFLDSKPASSSVRKMFYRIGRR
ncbi:MAG: Ig-like domain-containing protein [Verrucomicrobiota bacterium]